jgi:hypothetical protein
VGFGNLNCSVYTLRLLFREAVLSVNAMILSESKPQSVMLSDMVKKYHHKNLHRHHHHHHHITSPKSSFLIPSPSPTCAYTFRHLQVTNYPNNFIHFPHTN